MTKFDAWSDSTVTVDKAEAMKLLQVMFCMLLGRFYSFRSDFVCNIGFVQERKLVVQNYVMSVLLLISFHTVFVVNTQHHIVVGGAIAPVLYSPVLYHSFIILPTFQRDNEISVPAPTFLASVKKHHHHKKHKTYEQRQKEYKEARQRIFGDEGASDDESSSSSG